MCLIYFPDRKEHALSLFVNAKILPIAFLYWEAVCELKLDVHNNRAPSIIMKIFVRTLNNTITSILTHQHHYSLELNTLGVKIWNEMPNE